MPFVDTSQGRIRFCVLIPTRGRPMTLLRSLRKMPWLNDPETWILIETAEWDNYLPVRREFLKPIYWGDPHNPFENEFGSVACARERLRKVAVAVDQFHNYIVTDDNAIHESREALHNLVRAQVEWPVQPCIMAGMHNTAIHFDRGKIKHQEKINGLRSYPSVAMIFQCYPHMLYRRYSYPHNSYGLDDRHFFLWCIAHDVTQFRVCMDAPFTKSRYQEGGQGTIRERMWKNGLAIAQLASSFPDLVGATGTLRIPWQFLLRMKSGTATADRLPGGAMRKEESIVHSDNPATSRRARVRIHKKA